MTFLFTFRLPSNVRTPVRLQASAPTPDSSTNFSISLPIFGHSFNILPIFLLLLRFRILSISTFLLRSLFFFLLIDFLFFTKSYFPSPHSGSVMLHQSTGCVDSSSSDSIIPSAISITFSFTFSCSSYASLLCVIR